ncbi:uncharacterized protein F13E9.13, mitochondrial-like [Meleagris gallopavo]|uniref:uncharacterized protein F13E9.13, mitochondrial-like n=1 Tax=Meleagris gallopavo TaxID=9103 RepID=UPI00054998BC|nr:uncharacterized protein F13E9.13, mitochondrial-like [Meleagris gallopavo]
MNICKDNVLARESTSAGRISLPQINIPLELQEMGVCHDAVCESVDKTYFGFRIPGLDFIRVEGFVFSHVADEGIINACAGNLLRYRKLIGAENIQIFADIKKNTGKHNAHALTADISVAETASAAELFLADGVVLTGTATGLPADPGELREVQHAVKIPVLIGSGVTLENVKNYLDANALIIGSYFKREGYWANGVDPDRVKKFMERISKLRE